MHENSPVTDRSEYLAASAQSTVSEATSVDPSPGRFLKTKALEILVVDDQVSIQRVLTRLLGAEGYEVKTAGRVDEAVEVLRNDGISAVVLDVRMPGGSGLELLKFIRRDHTLRALPVLILTGVNLTREEEATIASHRAYVFYKSQDLHALITYLDHLTGL